MSGEITAIVSAIIAAVVTIISALLSNRFQSRKQLSEDERELRTTLLSEVKRLTDELSEAHTIIAKYRVQESNTERKDDR